MYGQVFFQSSAAVEPPGPLVQLIPLVLFCLIFWLLLIRPQRKRQAEHAAMLDSLKRGDTVMTAGGIIGKIAKIGPDEIALDVGEGTRLRVRRSMIADRPLAGQDDDVKTKD